jgi:hypothetical protein
LVSKIALVETLNADPNIALNVREFQVSPLWWALALGADLEEMARL